MAFMMRFYNNAAKIFGAKGILCRRFENLENKMVYTTRGKCSIYRASSVSVFFCKKFSRAESCAEDEFQSILYFLSNAIHEIKISICKVMTSTRNIKREDKSFAYRNSFNVMVFIPNPLDFICKPLSDVSIIAF